MTGAVIVTFALVTVLVLGTYLVQAALIAIQIAVALTLAAAQVAWTLLCALIWCGCFLARPRQAVAELRAAIARAEAEAAISRLNAA